MKNLFALLCCAALSSNLWANKIDRLKTDVDVIAFARSIDTAALSIDSPADFNLLAADEIYGDDAATAIGKKIKAKIWNKVDLNGDGLTDLLVYASCGRFLGPFAIMDKGDKTYDIVPLPQNLIQVSAIKANASKPVTVLLAYHTRFGRIWAKSYHFQEEPDTLIYQSGMFTMFNRHPLVQQNMVSISYSTFSAMDYGDPRGGDAEITVNLDGTGTYIFKGFAYDSDLTKAFKTVFPAGKVMQLFNLVSYMNVFNFNDRYDAPGVMDGGGWTLIINLTNGTKKEISEYNDGGPYQLQVLYTLLNMLHNKAKWELVAITSKLK